MPENICRWALFPLSNALWDYDSLKRFTKKKISETIFKDAIVVKREVGGFMEKMMERLNWIRDLVKSEERMEETGVVDMSIGFDNDKTMAMETMNFLEKLKNEMIDMANSFNEMKSSPLGRIKIYGIAKTQADFMLFRNGYKMIFSFRQPGTISIRFNFLGPNQYLPSQQMPSIIESAAMAQSTTANQAPAQLMEENLVIAKRGPFQELQWTFQEQKIDFTAMVKYHLTLFIRESAK